jgi:ferredoxin
MLVRSCANRSAITIIGKSCSGRRRRWNCTGTTTTAAAIQRSAGGWTGEKSSNGRQRLQSTTSTTTPTTTTTSTATTKDDNDNDDDNDPVWLYLREQLPTTTARTRRAVLAQLEPVFGRPITIAHLQSFSTTGLLDLAASIETAAGTTTTTVVEPEKEGTAAEEEESPRTTRRRPETMTTMMIPLHVYYDTPGRPPLKLTWKNPDRTTLLQALQDNIMTERLLEASCGGNASCCSCHVLVSILRSSDDNDEPQQQRRSYYSLSPVQEAEQDMLDYAAEYDAVKSRLACQVRAVVEKVTTTTTKDATKVATNDDKASIIMPTLSVTIPGTVNDLWK